MILDVHQKHRCFKTIMQQYCSVIYNALPSQVKIETFYLPFKQGLKELFMD